MTAPASPEVAAYAERLERCGDAVVLAAASVVQRRCRPTFATAVLVRVLRNLAARLAEPW